MQLFMMVNIYLEFYYGGLVFFIQVEKIEELDFFFVSLFERFCVIGRLIDKVVCYSIYLFMNFVVSSYIVFKVGGGGKIYCRCFFFKFVII